MVPKIVKRAGTLNRHLRVLIIDRRILVICCIVAYIYPDIFVYSFFLSKDDISFDPATKFFSWLKNYKLLFLLD